MNNKRITSAALALAMTASLAPAALAAAEPTVQPISAPLDSPMLISTNPLAGSYNKVITINGKTLEGYEYDRVVEGWGSESVSVLLSEIPNAPAGYLPLRAVIQADGGSAYWDGDANQSTFYLESNVIITDFSDMSISVNDEKVEGEALAMEGVTYVPSTVLNLLEGVTVTDNSNDEGESYAIVTPNGTPLMMMASSIMESAGLFRGTKQTPNQLEEIWGEAHGFKAEYMTEGVAFLPMITSPDTLILGKLAEGSQEDLEAALESYRKQQEETFSWYLSQNLPKVENAKFVVEGDWFCFLIAENVDEGVEAFRENVASLDAAND